MIVLRPLSEVHNNNCRFSSLLSSDVNSATAPNPNVNSRRDSENTGGGGGGTMPAASGAGMGIGGLFAGGMPKLRSTGSKLLGGNIKLLNNSLT